MKVIRALALAAATALAAAGSAGAAPKVGQPAPDFSVTTFDGKLITLKDLKGQVVVLNFWATWCGPCQRELPTLDAYLKVQKRFGLAVVAVTTEDSVEPRRLEPLQKLLTMRLARNFRGGGYGPQEAVPTNFVIDRAGVIRYAKAGAFDTEGLNAVLIPLLEEPSPDAPALSPATPVKTAAR